MPKRKTTISRAINVLPVPKVTVMRGEDESLIFRIDRSIIRLFGHARAVPNTVGLAGCNKCPRKAITQTPAVGVAHPPPQGEGAGRITPDNSGQLSVYNRSWKAAPVEIAALPREPEQDPEKKQFSFRLFNRSATCKVVQ